MKILAVVFLTTALTLAAGQTLEDCLQNDSISCVQKSLYRKAKEFFDKDSYELFSGVSLVKNADNQGRSSRTGKDLLYDQEIDTANNVADRQSALESFVSDEAGEFLTGRSLRINFAPAFEKIGDSARALSDSAPEEVRQAVNEIVEGRGKKKILKSILPLLIAAKVKIGALATLAYFGIGLLAKKAIFASLISLAISAFIGLKALWSKNSHDVTPYNGWSGGSSSGGWSAPVANGGWSSGSSWDDSHGYAQSQAYSGYHH
ncbi:hypothetical protein WH47_04931 [Habropoda laboriosa]|uniref:Osiris 6 n=1 Tax=Habropoda laboriosa TaxID=597456 RepID=A0A0L7RJA3_9HYME|nr:PREDICTED: uncharacterized protein LOC108570441 [Habropoda laboriosa]KOC70945.1 hypothetical protein WH47_04931 [Habropoda laboriosa]